MDLLINNELDLGLAQIYPVWDEDTSDERMAVRASFADPYIAILRDDATLLLLQADNSGDLDEVSINETIDPKWLSCCLYRDTSRAFSHAKLTSEESSQSDIILFLLSSDCKLFVSTMDFLPFD